ncbi:MAG TPA: amidase [Ktedonobacteraceae bacterium]|nr:amidase [Ktedonobacteraceae bacterium]
MEEWISTSATRMLSALQAREISSEELVSACLRRIAEVNPQINAVVQLAPEAALARARELDALSAQGRSAGPLHGLPFTAKDIFETAGIISSAGLEERENFIPQRDAVVVKRMKDAGAILLGKTNCPPGGAGGETTNLIYGATRNPYHRDYSPGGSSGGEAAIIAAAGSPLGLGSDSGGSIRLPAHYCGIAGMRPTSGRVPATGAYGLAGGLSDPRSQVGPMARYVEDLALMLPILFGEDWSDSGVVPMPLRDSVDVNLSALRVAFFTDDGVASPTPETVEGVNQSAHCLQNAGLRVEQSCPSGIAEAFDITVNYWRQAEMSGGEIEALLARWDTFRSRMLGFMRGCDVLLCPAAASPAVLCGEGMVQQFSYTLPFSLTGYPAVVVRVGTSPDGLPIGVQVVARPWREDVALAVAGKLEKLLGGWQAPPL